MLRAKHPPRSSWAFGLHAFMNREKINELDPIIVNEVVCRLPCYADSRVQNRYHSATSKKVAAWLRFSRQRPDGLFDCLHFARDYSESEGFLYTAESYLSFFPELPFPPGPFGDYCALQDRVRGAYGGGRDSLLGEFRGGSWFLLGGDLHSAKKRLAAVLDSFRDEVLPWLDSAAQALRGDPILIKAVELIDSVDVGADDAKDRLALQLLPYGEHDRRGYPIGKIAGQLVWRKRGKKSWYQV